MKLKAFLHDLAKIGTQKISHFVIGNASVDYDSFFGSIILAYILTSTTGFIHRPIIDCSKSELKLRFQIEAILEKVKIDPNVLQFRNSTKEPYPEGIYNLYDHNSRGGIQKIQYIVDHHSYSPDKIQAQKYLIDTMGSGLTLLYYLLHPNKLSQIQFRSHQNFTFIQKYKNFVKDEPFQSLKNTNLADPDIQQIIRYGIMIDTFNFDMKMRQRWTIFDKKAVDFIQSEQKCEHSYQWIQSMKFDVGRNINLTLNQALIKDRKKYTYSGIDVTYSIIYLQPALFCEHYKIEMQTIFNLAHQQSDVYFLMSIFMNQQKKFQREIIYRVKDKYQQKIDSALSECFKPLNLVNMGTVGEWNRWKDPSATISRKKFEPVVKQALQKLKL